MNHPIPLGVHLVTKSVLEMVFADDIRRTILRLADERGPEKTFALSDVAQAIDRHNWRGLIDQVRIVANVLVKEGKIIARKPFHGVAAELSKAGPPES
jgi:hypothetical protein